MSRKSKADPKPEITSASELARVLGVSEAVIRQQWVRKESWTWGRGPWTHQQVEEIRAWRETLQEDRSQAPGLSPPREAGSTESAKRAYLVVKTHREKHKLDVEKGEVHTKAECEAEKIEVYTRFRNVFTRDVRSQLSRGIEARFRTAGWALNGQQIHTIEDVYDQVVNDVFRYMSGES